MEHYSLNLSFTVKKKMETKMTCPYPLNEHQATPLINTKIFTQFL